MSPAPPPYDPSRIDFLAFGLFVDAQLVHRGCKPYQVARATDLTADHIRRARAQQNPGERAFFALCAWMETKPSLFMKDVV